MIILLCCAGARHEKISFFWYSFAGLLGQVGFQSIQIIRISRISYCIRLNVVEKIAPRSVVL